jgi:hypothetical protein
MTRSLLRANRTGAATKAYENRQPTRIEAGRALDCQREYRWPRSPLLSPGVRGSGGDGHSWFVDPEREFTVIALTNTALEGLAGRFPIELRDAIYRVL